MILWASFLNRRLVLLCKKCLQRKPQVITSSSDKQHQKEGEEMNEELLHGSFQLLVLQLKPGGLFSLQIL